MSAHSDWYTVVGVARDVKHYGVDEEMRPGLYQPLSQLPLQGFEVALRTRGDASAALSEARQVTAELDVELRSLSAKRDTLRSEIRVISNEVGTMMRDGRRDDHEGFGRTKIIRRED